MRILVLTARYGSGHLIAARGIVDALKYSGVEYALSDVDFSVLDIVESGGVTEKASSRAYEILMRRGHGIWKILYNAQALAASPFRRLYRFQVRNFVRMVEEWNPDAVISTHFLTSLIGVMYTERTGKPTFTVITDFAVHPLWVWEGTRRYYVGLERTAQEEPLRGKDVVVSGIPLRRGFWNPPGREEARRELGYPMNRTVVLISAGSYASVKVEPLLAKLRDMGVFVVLLAGRKKSAYDRFIRFYKESGVEGVVYPFVDFVPKIMAASDLFVTKAGGVSVAEALAVGLPMVFVNNMPGQEEMNARIIEEEGAGINACTPDKALKVIEELIRKPQRLKVMGKRARSLGKPDASLRIIRDAVSLIVPG